MRSLPQRPDAIPVEVRRLLAGRDIYVTVLERPNNRYYGGEWFLWYAEAKPLPGNEPRIQPPVVFRQVDPISERSVMASDITARVRASAVIRKTGFVDEVRIVFGASASLDTALKEALGRWTFQPALRSGAMVDVDAVFEVPIAIHAQVQPHTSE
jgi:hypothetical protein